MQLAWFLLLAAGPMPAEPTAPPAPLFVLEDQFQRPRNIGAAPGDVVVLIYGDRNSAEANRQLGAALHVHFHPAAQGQPPAQAGRAPVRPITGWPAGVPVPDVRVLAVACAGKVPGVVASLIRSQLRSKSPDMPVFLDFEDKMKQFYGLGAGVTNLAVIDTQGRVRCRAHGAVKPAQFGELTQFLEKLREEARPAR